MKEEAQEQQKNKKPEGRRANTNGVIITIYVESPLIRSQQKYDPLKSIKPNPYAKKPQSARTRGYDRRAQLLAYARELRDGNSEQLQWPKNNSRPKSKIWKWPIPLRESLRRMFHQRCRYELIVSDETTDVDRSCRPKCMNWRKTRTTKRCNSQFCKRLRCMWKGLLSSARKRNKG